MIQKDPFGTAAERATECALWAGHRFKEYIGKPLTSNYGMTLVASFEYALSLPAASTAVTAK
jgi:hypothetical protein